MTSIVTPRDRKPALASAGLPLLLTVALATHAMGQTAPILTFKAPALKCTIGDDNGHNCENVNLADPAGLAIGDITGTTAGSAPDGRPDVAVANSNLDGLMSAASVTVFRNTSNWTGIPPSNGLSRYAIVPMPNIIENARPYDVEFADMSDPLDGFLDMVVSAQLTDLEAFVVIYWNPGTAGNHGDFTPSNSTVIDLTSNRAFGLAVGYFDFDMKMDIAVAGAFQQSVVHPTKPQVEIIWGANTSEERREVVRVDATEDVGTGTAMSVVAEGPCIPGIRERRDLIVSMINESTERTFVLLNTGEDSNGITVWQPQVLAGRNSAEVEVGSLRTSSVRDVMESSRGNLDTNHMRVLWQNECGLDLQSPPPTYAMNPGTDPWGMDLGKLDLNTTQDLVVACELGGPDSEGCLAVYQGKGDGTFYTPPRIFRVEPIGPTLHKLGPWFVEIVDFNGDLRNDIICSNRKGGYVSVLINTSMPDNN